MKVAITHVFSRSYTKPPSIASRSREVAASPVNTSLQNWQVGDRVMHKTFGIGEITHVFGSGNKVSVAIKFPSLGQKN
jgi:DNA helicase-2/ATP-dependent DNA helicase PcrA